MLTVGDVRGAISKMDADIGRQGTLSVLRAVIKPGIQAINVREAFSAAGKGSMMSISRTRWLLDLVDADTARDMLEQLDDC